MHPTNARVDALRTGQLPPHAGTRAALIHRACGEYNEVQGMVPSSEEHTRLSGRECDLALRVVLPRIPGGLRGGMLRAVEELATIRGT